MGTSFPLPSYTWPLVKQISISFWYFEWSFLALSCHSLSDILKAAFFWKGWIVYDKLPVFAFLRCMSLLNASHSTLLVMSQQCLGKFLGAHFLMITKNIVALASFQYSLKHLAMGLFLSKFTNLVRKILGIFPVVCIILYLLCGVALLSGIEQITTETSSLFLNIPLEHCSQAIRNMAECQMYHLPKYVSSKVCCSWKCFCQVDSPVPVAKMLWHLYVHTPHRHSDRDLWYISVLLTCASNP